MSVDNGMVSYTKDFGIFPESAKLKGEGVGNGDLDYIFRVIEDKTGKSVVLKQADKFLRSSGSSFRFQLETESKLNIKT